MSVDWLCTGSLVDVLSQVDRTPLPLLSTEAQTMRKCCRDLGTPPTFRWNSLIDQRFTATATTVYLLNVTILYYCAFTFLFPLFRHFHMKIVHVSSVAWANNITTQKLSICVCLSTAVLTWPSLLGLYVIAVLLAELHNPWTASLPLVLWFDWTKLYLWGNHWFTTNVF